MCNISVFHNTEKRTCWFVFLEQTMNGECLHLGIITWNSALADTNFVYSLQACVLTFSFCHLSWFFWNIERYKDCGFYLVAQFSHQSPVMLFQTSIWFERLFLWPCLLLGFGLWTSASLPAFSSKLSVVWSDPSPLLSPCLIPPCPQNFHSLSSQWLSCMAGAPGFLSF